VGGRLTKVVRRGVRDAFYTSDLEILCYLHEISFYNELLVHPATQVLGADNKPTGIRLPCPYCRFATIML
jgi:hypothetical protein